MGEEGNAYWVFVGKPDGKRPLGNSFKYKQKDATLHNILYCCQCSICFRQLLRPSSGAQNCTHSSWTYTRCCVYSFELLMMGGEPA
jgi:hypothetical protein